MGKIALLVVICCLVGLPVYAQHTYAVGDTAADFTLLDSGGNSVSLSDYADRIKFLVFWEPG